MDFTLHFGHGVIFFHSLTRIITTTLSDLKKAIKGLVIMSESLESLAAALTVNKVPTIWAGKSYPSLKPLGSYINDLLERLKFFEVGTNFFQLKQMFYSPGTKGFTQGQFSDARISTLRRSVSRVCIRENLSPVTNAKLHLRYKF